MNNPNADLQSNPADPREDNFSRFIVVSVIVHLAAMSAMVLKAVFYPGEPLVLERAIRVDMVALPDKRASLPSPAAPAPTAAPKPKEESKAKEEPPKPVEQAKPKPEAPKPVALKPAPKEDTQKISLDKNKQAQESALKRLEALAKLEKMNSKPSAGDNPHAAPDAKPAQPIKGNQVSAGNSLTGIAKLDYDSYLDAMDVQVKKHWNLPSWMANANLKARVLVYIDAKGTVIKRSITSSSKNSVFDDKVLEAIDRASPFPAPPARLANILMVDGIEIRFPD